MLLPFRIDRASRIDLPRQVTDGLRSAIKTGFFKPGDVLPSVQEMRKFLGVSIRAPLSAIKTLKDEGLVASRRHVGCVVLGKHEMSWKGHVLVICPNTTPVFYKTVVDMHVSELLSENGYLTTRLMLKGSEEAGYDFSHLSLILKQPVSFVLVLGDRPKLFDFLAESGVPFAGFLHKCRLTRGMVGCIHYKRHASDSLLARHCREHGIRTLVQVGASGSLDFMDMKVFRREGVRLETLRVNYSRDDAPGVEKIMRAAYEMFDGWRPENGKAIFFIDDYIARGATTAMLENGIRLGEAVKVGSIVNKGIDLVFGRELARLEFDPKADGTLVANALLSYLENGVFPKRVAVFPCFKPGATMQ